MKSASQPTSVRHAVIAATALTAVLLYLDRFCISFAEIFIKEELRLTDAQVGWILGSFFLTYALGQVPSGWLTDRFGARIMMTSYVLLWSLFTGLTGIALGFTTLLVLRCGFGFAQAGAYPTAANLISNWVPLTRRGTASSIVAIGGRFGGALAPLATGYLILQFVPLSVSSQLEPGDLLDARQFCIEIAPGDKAPPSGADAPPASPAAEIGARILEHSAEIRSTVTRIASSPSPASPSDLDQLAAQLNELLAESGLHSAPLPDGLKLEKEAKRLLEIRQDLDQDQRERLNRLLLEAAFPASIRKVYGAGWRSVMLVYGVIGLLVAAVFWIVFRNLPASHPRCNAAEIELIGRGRPTSTAVRGRVRAVPIKAIVRSRSMWLSCVSQFTTNIGWVLLVTWAPRYFQSAHGVGVELRAWMVFIPPMVGWFGMVSGGWLTDRLSLAVGLRWGRALPMSLSRFVAMAAYLVCLYPWQSPWVSVAAFSVVSFSTDLGTAASWAFNQDVGGRYVGSILGWGNMFGNLGAFLASRFLISLVGSNDDWNVVFLACAAAFLISGVAALGIDATVPVVAHDD